MSMDIIARGLATKNSSQIANLTQQMILKKNAYITGLKPTSEQGYSNDDLIFVVDIPIKDYYFRFDASELNLANNSAVGTWLDMSDNNFDLTGAEDSRPTFLLAGLNGRPCVLFSGAEFLTGAFNLTVNNALTMFAMVKFDDLSGSQVVFTIGEESETHSNAQRYMLRKSSGGYLYTSIHANSAADAKIEPVDTEPMIVVGTYLSGTSNAIYKNGTLVDSSEYTQKFGSHDTLAIGKTIRIGSTDYFAGRLSELIYFQRVLNETEINIMHEYLSEKWGVTA